MLWLRFAPAARASKGRRDQGKGTRSTPSAVSVRDGRDRDAGRAPLERREKGLGTSLVSISAPFTQRESLCSKGCPGLVGVAPGDALRVAPGAGILGAGVGRVRVRLQGGGRRPAAPARKVLAHRAGIPYYSTLTPPYYSTPEPVKLSI
jgi:hypothetical protein